MMRRRGSTEAVVHIGQMKTGTSALQTVLDRNAGQLNRAGVLYPSTGRFDSRHAQIAWALWAREETLTGWPAQKASDLAWPQLLEHLRDEIETASADAVILSAEELSLRPASYTAPLIEALGDDVRVVVYLRRQDEMVESMYRQHVKGQGTTKTFEEYCESNLGSSAPLAARLDYESFLDDWSDLVGPSALSVATYDEAKADGIVAHFAAVTGLVALLELPAADRVNESFRGPALEFLRRANDYVPRKDRARFLADLAVLADAAQFSHESLVTRSLGMDIRERYARSNESVARRFFQRDVLFPAR